MLTKATGLLLVLCLTVLAYLPGLAGPFLFDDTVHVTNNPQVHIDDLSPSSLVQAWHSSLASGISSRPLAQLSFGVNHALSGLDSMAFKTTNLVLHMLAGLLVYGLTRQLTRVLSNGRPGGPADSPWPALLVTGLWLLHPINLTPVLYVVQRMTTLSTLFVLAGLWCHVTGRTRMAAGDGRGLWLALAGLPVAAIGGLAKESAALYPVLVAVLEWTLLRDLAAARRKLLLTVVVAVPVIVGALYLLTHPGLLAYDTREFTMQERVLTETRVLWLYLQMLAVPNPTLLGFYHDDIATSTSLLVPWTTALAVVGWLLLIPAALLGARRWPVLSFGLLFFLAGHLLESTVFPLELVFEHRNYLPSLGPLFVLAWLVTRQTHPVIRRWLALGSVLLVLGLAAVTHVRALDWSDHNRLVLSEVQNHPDSPRANFRTAQILMDQIGTGDDPAKAYQAARFHLDRTRQLDPDNVNALFGLVILELFAGRDPGAQLLDALQQRLAEGPVGPTQLAIGQFSFLVRWQLSGAQPQLPHSRVLAIMEAGARNPLMNTEGRAAIYSSLRAYHDRVLQDPETAVGFARKAVKTWPTRWIYHYRLVDLLVRLGQTGAAKEAYARALNLPSAALNPAQVAELAAALDSANPAQSPND